MKQTMAPLDLMLRPPIADRGGRSAALVLRGMKTVQFGRRIVLPCLLAATLLCAWEFGTRLAHLSPLIIVPPSAVLSVLMASYAILMQQAVPTVVETLIGFALAAAIGIMLGTALVLSRRVRQALYPHVLTFQLIPKIALAPLFIVWFGVGPTSRLSLAVFMAFFPVVISTLTGLLSADRNAMRMARAMMASPWQSFISVRVPFALPHIFAGLKVAVTMAMIGVIVGEFVTAQAGLGYIIMMASSAGDTALVLAAIILLCGFGLLLYGAVALAEWLIDRRMGVSITSSEF
ncbi:MAG TPA: ABC transporter permease [Xanthobacteraceae bacterium]|nr:ABC transporter permease [Xanthobacteraceae bacterium]